MCRGVQRQSAGLPARAPPPGRVGALVAGSRFEVASVFEILSVYVRSRCVRGIPVRGQCDEQRARTEAARRVLCVCFASSFRPVSSPLRVRLLRAAAVPWITSTDYSLYSSCKRALTGAAVAALRAVCPLRSLSSGPPGDSARPPYESTSECARIEPSLAPLLPPRCHRRPRMSTPGSRRCDDANTSPKGPSSGILRSIPNAPHDLDGTRVSSPRSSRSL